MAEWGDACTPEKKPLAQARWVYAQHKTAAGDFAAQQAHDGRHRRQTEVTSQAVIR